MDYGGLGGRIRIIRKSRGLSQEKLAELTGYSCSYIGLIERGSRKLSVAALAAIAHALSCSVDDLLNIERRSLSNSEKLEMLLEEAIKLVRK